MEMLKIGDIVARKSYGCDILFKIVDIVENECVKTIVLKGIFYRLLADAPESDLILQSENESGEQIEDKDEIHCLTWIEKINNAYQNRIIKKEH